MEFLTFEILETINILNTQITYNNETRNNRLNSCYQNSRTDQ